MVTTYKPLLQGRLLEASLVRIDFIKKEKFIMCKKSLILVLVLFFCFVFLSCNGTGKIEYNTYKEASKPENLSGWDIDIDVVPDVKTAIKISDMIYQRTCMVESYGRSTVSVVYYEEDDVWMVCRGIEGSLGGGMVFFIKKSTGEVLRVVQV